MTIRQVVPTLDIALKHLWALLIATFFGMTVGRDLVWSPAPELLLVLVLLPTTIILLFSAISATRKRYAQQITGETRSLRLADVSFLLLLTLVGCSGLAVFPISLWVAENTNVDIGKLHVSYLVFKGQVLPFVLCVIGARVFRSRPSWFAAAYLSGYSIHEVLRLLGADLYGGESQPVAFAVLMYTAGYIGGHVGSLWARKASKAKEGRAERPNESENVVDNAI